MGLLKKDIKIFQIVIKDNEKSEYYHNYTKPSWETAGFCVLRFNAITPQRFDEHNYLRFSDYVMSVKYTAKKLKKIFTDTEKAVWYSHFSLWEKCIALDEPIVILEQDVILLDSNKLVIHPKSEMIFYDRAAMGSYYLTPRCAKILVNKALNQTITAGPYAFIDEVIRENKDKGSDFIINCRHKKYDPATRQVMSRKFGNTIDHYKGTAVEHLADTFPQHDFLMID